MTSKVTPEIVAVTKLARAKGYFCHVIAAYYRINQGRISEICTGKRGVGIEPASTLPPDFPAMA